MSDLAAHFGDEGAARVIVYQHAGLEGLEVWHGIARHTTLYQLRDDRAAYFAGLAEFLRRLQAAVPRRQPAIHSAARPGLNGY